MSVASSFGPGERTAAERIAPRRRSTSLRTASPKPGCCSWRTSGRYASNRSSASSLRPAANSAHTETSVSGIGEAGHDSVGAARQFLRYVQPAIADQDADVASRATIAAFADLRELLQAGAVLVLEHHHGRMSVDDFEEALGGDVGLRRLRVVLVHDRDVFAQRRHDFGEVADDLRFGLQTGEWRDHDAAGARVHRGLAELDEIGGAGVRDADDDRHAAIHAAQEVPRKLSRLVAAEFLRLAHHSEDGQPLHAASHVELDQAVDARPIDVARIGEWRCRDCVNAFSGRIEQLTHGSAFGLLRMLSNRCIYLADAEGQPRRRRLRPH